MLSLSKLFENWDKQLQTETLDEFRVHVEASLQKKQKRLQNNYFSLPYDQFENTQDIDDYRMHIDELMYEVATVQKLADELSIIALYKQVELHLKRVIVKSFPKIDEKKLSEINSLKKVLPFKVETLPDFSAYDELRLINNAIKHQGRVSKQLANKFPIWKLNDELKELGVAYSRLLPLIKNYVHMFVVEVYANSKKFIV